MMKERSENPLSSTKVVSEERMRELTSKEIDEISAGFCPFCFFTFIAPALLTTTGVVAGAGATMALYSSETYLLIGASSLALTVSLTTGIWFLNSEKAN
jgi:hypothetical protein